MTKKLALITGSTQGIGLEIAPADVMGLTGVGSTSSVGALAPADVVGLTGVSSTSNVGQILIGLGVALTGVSATSSVGGQ